MNRTTVTYRSAVRHPLNVRFTCPVCGTENVCDHSFETYAAETYGGYLREGSKELEYAKLEDEAKSKANDRAKELAYEYSHGRGMTRQSANGITAFTCKKCGVVQIPECCKDQKSFGTRKGCLTSILIWVVFVVAYIVSLITLVKSGTVFLLLTLAFCAITTAIIVLEIRLERMRTKRAVLDPKVMKEYYNAVINDHIEFDFTEYGQGIVRAGQDKLEEKVQDNFSVYGRYFRPGAQGADAKWSVLNEEPGQLRCLDMGNITPAKIPLKDIESIDIYDIKGKGERTCMRLTMSNGAAHIIDLKKEQKARLAVSQLTPLWQYANRPMQTPKDDKIYVRFDEQPLN